MIIDNEEGFDTDIDELVWTKIISIKPFYTRNKSTHVVKYYKTESDEEYYIFEYIRADNNGNFVGNFTSSYWSAVIEQFDINDNALVYAQDTLDKNDYWLVTRGNLIKKDIEEDMN